MTEPKFPEDVRYTKSHEWARLDGDDLVIGITDYAQAELTDVVFVDLPAVGKVVVGGASALVLESVKTVTDVYAPVAGTVTASNVDLKAHPELVNQDPYGRGWIFRLRPTSAYDPSALLDASGYRAVVAGPSH
ncbi:MAG TPA: glycine cleavage system protein GcvH [Thermoplasmata archaeon]